MEAEDSGEKKMKMAEIKKLPVCDDLRDTYGKIPCRKKIIQILKDVASENNITIGDLKGKKECLLWLNMYLELTRRHLRALRYAQVEYQRNFQPLQLDDDRSENLNTCCNYANKFIAVSTNVNECRNQGNFSEDHEPKISQRQRKTKMKDLTENNDVKELYEKYPGNSNEKVRDAIRLANFDIKNADCYGILWRFFDENVTMKKLLKLAIILSENLKIYLDRDASRDRKVLYRWFYEFWDTIKDVLHQYHYNPSNGEIIYTSPSDEQQPNSFDFFFDTFDDPLKLEIEMVENNRNNNDFNV